MFDLRGQAGETLTCFFLDAYTRAKLAIELKGLFAAKAKENQIRKPESVCQNSDKQIQPIDTKKELARRVCRILQTLLIQGTRTDFLQNSAKSIQPIDTRKELARIAGTSHDTITKVERIERDAPPLFLPSGGWAAVWVDFFSFGVKIDGMILDNTSKFSTQIPTNKNATA